MDPNTPATGALAPEGTPTPTPVATPPATQPAGFSITVNGEKRTVSQDELVKMAEKAAGADEKFRQAAEDRRQAAAATRALEILKGIGTGQVDANALNELSGVVGVDPSRLQGLLNKPAASAAAADDDDDNAGDDVPLVVTRDKLDPQTQGLLDWAQKQMLQNKRDEIKQEVKNSVDKDEVLATLLKVVPEGQLSEMKETLFDMVFKDVQRSILAEKQYGPETITAAVQRVRALVKKLGTPAQAAKDPVSIGFSGFEGLTAGIQTDKDLERKSVQDAGYDDNAALRLAQALTKAMRG